MGRSVCGTPHGIAAARLPLGGSTEARGESLCVAESVAATTPGKVIASSTMLRLRSAHLYRPRMIKPSRALIIGGLMASLPLRAVYAPIREQEQGKDLTVSVKGGVSYASNIFGAATNERDSVIWTLAPRAAYNASLTAQTFFSAGYGIT